MYKNLLAGSLAGTAKCLIRLPEMAVPSLTVSGLIHPMVYAVAHRLAGHMHLYASFGCAKDSILVACNSWC